MGVELIWEGKNTDFQIPQNMVLEEIESVDFPVRSYQPDLFDETLGDYSNILIHGDNLLAMSALLKDFEGKVNMIYIDPPFNTGRDFGTYNDKWGMDEYLQMMYDRLVLMRELLADNGSIYLHLDWYVGHYMKLMLDEILGKDNLRNEIIWRY